VVRSAHPPARRAVARATLAVVLLTTATALPAALGVVTAPPALAAPGSTGTAQAEADALRAQVEDLEGQVEVAAEEHDAVEGQLATAVSEEFQAERVLDAAQQHQRAARTVAGTRARAVARAPGGRLGLALGVLRGAEPADVLDDYRALADVVDADRTAQRDAARQVDAAVAASARVQALRVARQALEARAAASAQQASDALAQRTELLAAADARVVDLVQAQRQAREAAASATAAASLRALGADSGTTTATGAAATAISAARTKLGAPYVWGATGPDAFDCSGLVQWAYAQAGVALPRTTRQEYAALPRVPLADLSPGDLVLYASGGPDATPATIHHVGLYLGGGLMVHAPHTGDVVRIAAVTRDDVFAVVRPWEPSGP
jgi:cell wall-associated NlpC family hydrolase